MQQIGIKKQLFVRNSLKRYKGEGEEKYERHIPGLEDLVDTIEIYSRSSKNLQYILPNRVHMMNEKNWSFKLKVLFQCQSKFNR